MTTYVLSYHGGTAEIPTDPAEVEKLMAAWGAWFGQLGDAVVDGGNPIGAASTIAPDGTVTEGQQVSLTGYSILQAASLDEAVAMAKGCPVLAEGGSVQVGEAVQM
ncbi:MAG: YciI family protein [Actinomycetota bacterium]